MKFRLLCILSFFIISGCEDPQNTTNINTREINIIETEQFIVQPSSSMPELRSFSWSQTCGSPALSEKDKQSKSFTFTAPESTQDEDYCFELNGIALDGSSQRETLLLTVVAPTLEVYIDHASLPTLQQLMRIVSSYQANPSHKRFISWGRLTLSNEALTTFKATSFPIDNIFTSEEMINAIEQYAATKNRLNLEIYTNTDRSFGNVAPILKRLNAKDNVKIKKIVLYDDGSAEYVNLYRWRTTTNKLVELETDKTKIENYIKSTSTEKPTKIGGMYNWHKLYPAKYIFLRKDYLDVESELSDLKTYLSDTVEQMLWDTYQNLSIDNQRLFLSIVGFDKNVLQSQYDRSPLPNFIFTGTTTWRGGDTAKFFADQQINVIRNAINDTSPLYLGQAYDLFFKGHPRGGEINDMILAAFPEMINIPASISFEVLMMTGMLPDNVSGIASSLYFTIPANKVGFIVFTSSDTISDREEALQSPLVQVMIKLGIVQEESVLFWADLPDCSTGVCIEK